MTAVETGDLVVEVMGSAVFAGKVKVVERNDLNVVVRCAVVFGLDVA